MVEKPDVVIRVFDRLDLACNEPIEFGEIGDEVSRQCKIQGGSPRCRFCCRLVFLVVLRRDVVPSPID
jgi:hypothetical protein